MVSVLYCAYLCIKYVNHELPDVQAGFRKGRGTRDQIANIRWIMEKAREFQKNIYSLFIDCGKFLKRWEYQSPLPASWEACMQVKKQHRTRHGTTDWFNIGKWVWQAYILSPCLFNFYTAYITHYEGLDESQARIKFARRNINNLRYEDDSTLMADRKSTRLNSSHNA